ncbi:DnaJ-like protein subfamily C member 2 [Nematocida sp. AWRm77]|nr:DnaJ-like protein subfamily C member 2 [Nematocida sp. AWRm77]
MTLVLHTGKRTFENEESAIEQQRGEKLMCPKELFKRYTMKEIKQWKGLDLYYLMGVYKEEADGFSDAEFKNAFKKQAKLFHPDILNSFQIEDGGASFIALTRAYNVLSTPGKKKQYDCVFFDESIPESKQYTPEEFFSVFTPVFKRNAVFSTKPYSVDFGDAKTPEDQVVSFYRFWQSFESSRSFEFLCSEEDCLNREAKRQAVLKNKEILSQKKMEDNQRIKKLIEVSIKNDPRLKQNKKANKPAEAVTVDSEGWKSTELAKLAQLIKSHPRTLKNRVELIASSFIRYFPSRNKKDLPRKILQLEQTK